MSIQLFNPNAKKFVNVSAAQLDTLRSAGWLNPGDERINEILEEKTGEKKKSDPVKKISS